jgi:hypothetical protein
MSYVTIPILALDSCARIRTALACRDESCLPILRPCETHEPLPFAVAPSLLKPATALPTILDANRGLDDWPGGAISRNLRSTFGTYGQRQNEPLTATS